MKRTSTLVVIVATLLLSLECQAQPQVAPNDRQGNVFRTIVTSGGDVKSIVEYTIRHRK